MKNLKIFSLFLISIVAIGSCTKDKIITDVGFNFGEDFELKVAETAQASKADLTIKVTDVLEDSRCPINAYCTWAGQVKLEVEINDDGQIDIIEMIYSRGSDLTLEHGNYVLSITQVTPESQIDEILELEDYTFTFKIKKI